MKKTAILASAIVLMAGHASARDQIRVVGSSTVFPFATAVSEQFGKKTGFETPIVESTGSGGGLKLFCAGVGTDHPDVANASRRMKAKEWMLCQENGVTDIIEVKIGFDGIVIGNATAAPAFELERKDIYKALAAKVSQYGTLSPNKFTMWTDVNPALPAQKIKVLGPPPTSGTRDAFEELAMQKGAVATGRDKTSAKEVEIREDGVFVEAGENDNLIIGKLEADPTALGVSVFRSSIRMPAASRVRRLMVWSRPSRTSRRATIRSHARCSSTSRRRISA